MTPDTYTRQDFSKAIRGLSKNQRDVMSAVAFGDDGGHHPKTLEALEKRGLIKHTTQQLGGRFPVTIRRYFMPIHVHIQFCEWCSRACEAEVTR